LRRKHLTLWGTGEPGRFTVPNPPGISNLTETQLHLRARKERERQFRAAMGGVSYR
jgi:hypothetical protein